VRMRTWNNRFASLSTVRVRTLNNNFTLLVQRAHARWITLCYLLLLYSFT